MEKPGNSKNKAAAEETVDSMRSKSPTFQELLDVAVAEQLTVNRTALQRAENAYEEKLKMSKELKRKFEKDMKEAEEKEEQEKKRRLQVRQEVIMQNYKMALGKDMKECKSTMHATQAIVIPSVLEEMQHYENETQ